MARDPEIGIRSAFKETCPGRGPAVASASDLQAIRSKLKKADPNPEIAALSIAGMALVVALVFQALGPATFVDRSVEGWVAGLGLEGEMRSIPRWIPWIWTILATVGLCHSVIWVQGTARRSILVVSTLLLTLSWVLVLSLAAYQASIGAPLAAIIWGGVGSTIYAARH